MEPDLKKKWVDALRSGDFPQGHGHLCRVNKFAKTQEEEELQYCCLGVLCEVHPEVSLTKEKSEFGGIYEYSSPNTDYKMRANLCISFANSLGLGGDAISTLINMNDSLAAPFAEIADYIEENL